MASWGLAQAAGGHVFDLMVGHRWQAGEDVGKRYTERPMKLLASYKREKDDNQIKP